MDFELTNAQRNIKQRAAEFADQEAAPGASERDRGDEFPRGIFTKLADEGFMGLCISEQYGGAGRDFLSYALLIEELSRADAGVGVTLAVHTSAGTLPILDHGTDEQKSRWIPPLARGEKLSCFCLTEPGAGSDAASIESRAEPVDGGYRLYGHKQWVTNGRAAQTAIVFARAPEGVTAFIVPTDADGLTFGKHAEKLGVISATTDDIHLDGVFVPEEDRLGPEGKGLRVALSTLGGGRVGIAAQSVGIAEAALRYAVRYASERETFGSRIGDHQAIAAKLADMKTSLEAARLLTYRAAWTKDSGELTASGGAQAKLFASRTANQVVFDALQVLGGQGYMKDHPVERHYRDARVTEIYEGTSEIQRLVIARELLNELQPAERIAAH